jgi:sensor histidine kinase YesM
MDEMFRLSEICVPILHNGELLGVIDSEHHELNYFKERDLKILMTIATLTGNKLKQLESEQSLQMKHEELMTINEQLAEAQLSALQTQMNPHFIFNALNGIKRMILTNDANNASRYLSKFALMIRLTLNQSRQSFATLRENIDYLESYLAMEKLRFGSTFSYHIQTEENLEDEEILVPTLMIQPLVENAIWHGQMNNEGKNQLNIGFSRHEDTFTCTVEDNGIGIQQSKKRKLKEKSAHNYQSVGLDNLRKRIHIMNKKYQMDCALDIIDRSENGDSSSGTLATLSFKIIDR